MKPKCKDIPGRADAYIDREGPIGERLGTALHLVTCHNCRSFVRGLRRTKLLAASSFRTQSPDAVVRRLGLGDGPNTDTDRGAP